MNQQQARVIAAKALALWNMDRADKRLSTDVICDALHAAFEAERAPVSKAEQEVADEIASKEAHAKRCTAAARLASIKETARAIFSWTFAQPDTFVLRRCYVRGDESETALQSDCDAAVRFAEALEDAFERRYGGGR